MDNAGPADPNRMPPNTADASEVERGTKRANSWDIDTNETKNPRLAPNDMPLTPPSSTARPGSTLLGTGLPVMAALPNTSMQNSVLLPGMGLPNASPSSATIPGAVMSQMPLLNGFAPAIATWIPTERIGDVLGLRGAIIQRIKQVSGAVQIHIQEEAGCPMTPVQVAGTPEAAVKVGEFVHAVLDGQHEAIGYVREVFNMPEKMKLTPGNPVGHVLKRVSAASGAWVQQPDPNGPLVITGMPQAVTQAREMFLEEGEGGKLGGDDPVLVTTPLCGMLQTSPSVNIGGCMHEHLFQQFHSPIDSVAQPPNIDASNGGSPATASTNPNVALANIGHGSNIVARLRPGYGAAGPNQVLTADFEIPAQRVKDVLGVKGRNVKAIKQQSGIQKIGITDRSDPATVTVTGTQAAIETCRFMVISIISGDQSVIGNVVETMEIDQRIVSKFIGPKGQVISQIKDQSGAYLEVREIGGGQPPRIIMTGPPDCVVRARDLIIHFLTEHGVSATSLSKNSTAGAMPGADAYAQYYAQAKFQEARIHAQIQEAQLQAQIQEAQIHAIANLQFQAQLQAQSATNPFAANLQAQQSGGSSSACPTTLQPSSPPQMQPQPVTLAQLQQFGLHPTTMVPSLQVAPPMDAQHLLNALEAIQAQQQGS